MRNVKISVAISFSETDEPVTNNNCVDAMDDGSFQVILGSEAEFDIDLLEDALLRTNYPALRASLSQYLEQANKKKALQQAELANEDCRVEEHANPYQVDGEIGRFSFKTYDVQGEDKTMVYQSLHLFPTRTGKQWYPTCGFKERALMSGAAQRSYRQTVDVLNHSRRQETGGTPLNTLCDVAHTEGLKVLDFLTRKMHAIFNQHGFDEAGKPIADCAATQPVTDASFLNAADIQPALSAVCDDMKKRGFSEQEIEQFKKTTPKEKTYEHPEQSVYVHIDDVCVKEQKEHRKTKKTDSDAASTEINNQPEIETAQQDTDKKRPTVQNTVARIEQGNKGFTLTGRGVLEVLKFVLAFLLNNSLIGLNIKICTDGQRHLQDAIVTFFSWHKRVSYLLDWFHLVKKFKEDLSLACKGRDIRNQHLKKLLRLLWFGLVDQALAYLKTIPEADIKNKKFIERLTNYLNRNRSWIPCYALRKKLGLPNSSSPVERSNNQVTAHRQKHQGMSWSKAGTYALTALNAVIVNGATQQWVKNRSLPLVWVPRADKKAA